uniref:Uncharacterized protein n=1 Tax=Oryza glumipatula TaxID=40148 RepID=A0A0E0B9Y0_9ORYZ
MELRGWRRMELPAPYPGSQSPMAGSATEGRGAPGVWGWGVAPRMELADNFGIGVRELVVARTGAPLPPPDLECGCHPRASPPPD